MSFIKLFIKEFKEDPFTGIAFVGVVTAIVMMLYLAITRGGGC